MVWNMHNEITYIEPNLILPNLYQPRKYFDEDAITELAESIESYGIIQPLSVRKMREGRYELVAGERRLRAAIIRKLAKRRPKLHGRI